jgi:hypothetical protein
MTMPRHKNLTVGLPEPTETSSKRTYTWDTIKVAALYDLRDELQESKMLQQDILAVLKRMDRRMAKHMPLWRK